MFLKVKDNRFSPQKAKMRQLVSCIIQSKLFLSEFYFFNMYIRTPHYFVELK